MVWTPAQTQVFLTRARKHWLCALLHLIAHRGPRRGEACGLRHADTDLRTAVTTIRWQIVQLGWATEQGEPKTGAGERHVALDTQIVTVIAGHRLRQDAERDQAWDAWTDSGFEFTRKECTPLHPAEVTGIFELIACLAGLPRSGYTTCATSPPPSLAAGVDIKIVQEQLGHSSRASTSDTYTSVLPEVVRAAAEAAAALLPMDTTGTREPADRSAFCVQEIRGQRSRLGCCVRCVTAVRSEKGSLVGLDVRGRAAGNTEGNTVHFPQLCPYSRA